MMVADSRGDGWRAAVQVGDLQNMWKQLSEARKKAGEDGEDGEEMPEGPIVQVSDLQTMARVLVEANSTDDVMFVPSSNALRQAQRQGESARARSRGDGDDDAAGAATATAPAAPPAATDAKGAGGDSMMSDPVAFEGEEEDASGVL
jgi:hypothetical protein